jgi:hypothetical protein
MNPRSIQTAYKKRTTVTKVCRHHQAEQKTMAPPDNAPGIGRSRVIRLKAARCGSVLSNMSMASQGSSAKPPAEKNAVLAVYLEKWIKGVQESKNNAI